MGIEVVISIIGIVVGVLVSVWLYRKANPKRQLRYRVDVTPLLAGAAQAGARLSVALDGQAVTQPQMLVLSLWSSGRADISSQSFDAGTPLRFDLGVTIVEEISVEGEVGPRLEIEEPTNIILRPALLHRRYQSTIRVIVDGEPRVIVNRVLPDIDVLREGKSETAKVIDSSRRRFRITPLSVWAVLLALAIVALFVGPIVYNFDQQAFLPLGVVSLLLASLSLLSVIIIAIYRLIRWIGRNIEARSGLR